MLESYWVPLLNINYYWVVELLFVIQGLNLEHCFEFQNNIDILILITNVFNMLKMFHFHFMDVCTCMLIHKCTTSLPGVCIGHKKAELGYKWFWTILLVLDTESEFFASAPSILNFTPATKPLTLPVAFSQWPCLFWTQPILAICKESQWWALKGLTWI